MDAYGCLRMLLKGRIKSIPVATTSGPFFVADVMSATPFRFRYLAVQLWVRANFSSKTSFVTTAKEHQLSAEMLTI